MSIKSNFFSVILCGSLLLPLPGLGQPSQCIRVLSKSPHDLVLPDLTTPLSLKPFDLMNTFVLSPKQELLNSTQNQHSRTSPWSVLVNMIRTWISDEGAFTQELFSNSGELYNSADWNRIDGNNIETRLEIKSFPTHRRKQIDPQYWVMEFTKGSLERDGFQIKVIFSISKVAHSDQLYMQMRTETSSQEERQGSPSKLKLITLIQTLLHRYLPIYFDFNDGLGQQISKLTAQTLSLNSLSAFTAKLRDTHRAYPLILVSSTLTSRGGHAKKPFIDLDKITRYFLGMAEVYYIPPDEEINTKLNHLLGQGRFLIPVNGDLRLISNDPNYLVLDYMTSQQLRNNATEVTLSSLKKKLLEYYSKAIPRMKNNQPQATSIRQIQALNEVEYQRADVEKFEHSINQIQSEISLIEKLIQKTISTQSEISILEDRYADLSREIQELQTLLNKIKTFPNFTQQSLKLEEKLGEQQILVTILNEDIQTLKPFFKPQLSERNGAQKLPKSNQEVFDLENPPSNFREMLKSIESEYPGQIVFADEAYSGGKELKTFLSRNGNRVLLFKVLSHTATTLRDIYLNSSISKVEEFKKAMLSSNISHVTLAQGESSQTLKNNRLANLRVGNYKGIPYKGYAHVCYDNGLDNIFRIHFVFDRDSQRIIVTRITTHLPIASGVKK